MESRPTLPLDSKAGKLSSDSSGKCSCFIARVGSLSKDDGSCNDK